MVPLGRSFFGHQNRVQFSGGTGSQNILSPFLKLVSADARD
jgi:hypothetical protein